LEPIPKVETMQLGKKKVGKKKAPHLKRKKRRKKKGKEGVEKRETKRGVGK